MTALGLAARGRHCRPPWYQRALTRLRTIRQGRRVEDARDDAYVVRIEAHAVPPLVQAMVRVASYRAVTDGFGQPPAAVLPDEDVPGLEHLQRAWDDDTGTFPAQARGWTQ